MADTQDVKAQLSAFRLRPKKAQSPASSPMSPSFSFPSITPSHSNSSMKSTNSTSSTSSTRVSSASSVASSPELPLPPKSRPHSHHKRKSSVSTRRESSEIMGVPCPEESEEDSRDEIRKRALLALEGRSVVAGFAKVEIPDWISPTSDNKAFEKETGE
ncbi:uncharacterized protein EI90DRAFT_3043005 [Cantharellus anzutake]|uniref:uncharacterized protein n=1 Tax=Cantharellus anzutake TaxID=1750568 RepID=UPI0019073B6A|nr:uncharacterized protein EI90DRAFT_3043005 [Cantharellus anzutake]KAF8337445.1 hypothetical protein EI90DRAFT_3043005 [Cantharellus anzutake]